MESAQPVLTVRSIEEAIRWYIDATPSRVGIRSAPFGAAFARAYLFYDDDESRARLNALCEILNTGMCISTEDSAAVALRERMNKIFNSKMKVDNVDVYRRTERAIEAFMDRRKITPGHLFPVDEEEFPSDLLDSLIGY